MPSVASRSYIRCVRLRFYVGVEQVPGPAHVQALIAQPPVEAFHMSILRRLPWLNVDRVDAPLDTPGQEVTGA
jgi:hypothetical protein